MIEADPDRPAVPGLAYLLPLSAVVLMVVGSIGPWFKIGGVTGDGLDRDGVITLILAIVAAALVGLARVRARAPTRIGLVVCAILALATCVYDIIDILGTELLSPSLGWGIIVATLGSLDLAVSATVGRLLTR